MGGATESDFGAGIMHTAEVKELSACVIRPVPASDAVSRLSATRSPQHDA